VQAITAQQLSEFEEKIATLFTAKKIPAVTHLCGEAYQELVEIFRGINEEDWVLGTWRSHCHCLLKGVSRDRLTAAILAGDSVALCFPDKRILCSAIVGGSLPIAVGIAMGIKRSGGKNRVHAFLGDMASTMGIAHECRQYAKGFDLPISFYIENNGMSAQTCTLKAWGLEELPNKPAFSYERKKYLHAGAREWLKF